MSLWSQAQYLVQSVPQLSASGAPKDRALIVFLSFDRKSLVKGLTISLVGDGNRLMAVLLAWENMWKHIWPKKDPFKLLEHGKTHNQLIDDLTIEQVNFHNYVKFPRRSPSSPRKFLSKLFARSSRSQVGFSATSKDGISQTLRDEVEQTSFSSNGRDDDFQGQQGQDTQHVKHVVHRRSRESTFQFKAVPGMSHADLGLEILKVC